jgi:nicotinamidase/pyrazinamidase
VTRDWHPKGHCSFAEQGGPWPPHCIQDTEGAAFSAELEIPGDALVVSKADRVDRDAYSGFEGTDLDGRLRELGANRVFVGGLATDYCVLNTVKDALQLGYETFLLTDAVRAVNVEPTDGQNAQADMLERGARPVSLSDFDTNAL